MDWKVSREDTELHRIPIVEDQRRFRRIKMIIGIVCRRKDKSTLNVFTDDVSLGGIKFTSQKQLNPGEIVDVSLPLGHGRYQEVKGKVKWIRPGLMSSCEGGIEFVRLDTETFKLWQKFVERNADK